MMKNLYEETRKIMEKHDLHERDILLVYTKDGIMDTERFIERAKELNYDCGYGITYVETSLTVLFEDGRLEREEYDGAEEWRYISYNATVPHGRYFGDLFSCDYAREHMEEKLKEMSENPPDNVKEIFERFKAGEKISSDDLLSLQKSGFL